jgi:hypothetical protein
MQHPLLPQPPGRHASGAPSVLKRRARAAADAGRAPSTQPRGGRGRQRCPPPSRARHARPANRGWRPRPWQTVHVGHARSAMGIDLCVGWQVMHVGGSPGAVLDAAGHRLDAPPNSDSGGRGALRMSVACVTRHGATIWGRVACCACPQTDDRTAGVHEARSPTLPPAYNQLHAYQRPSNRLAPLRDRPRAPPGHRRA